MQSLATNYETTWILPGSVKSWKYDNFLVSCSRAVDSYRAIDPSKAPAAGFSTIVKLHDSYKII
jgi:hypothetical protein